MPEISTDSASVAGVLWGQERGLVETTDLFWGEVERGHRSKWIMCHRPQVLSSASPVLALSYFLYSDALTSGALLSMDRLSVLQRMKATGISPPLGLIQRKQWHSTPVLLPGKSHGWRSLVGCSPWGRLESDTTEQLHFHFSIWCTGEGNGKPLQCSCLGNPRDGGTWGAAVLGVTQSLTRLKWLSSSRSSVWS